MTTDSKREAAMCDELVEWMGYKVINLEQQRATRVHVGLPDRLFQGKYSVFFEYKFGRDKLAREQHRFLQGELDSINGIASCGGLAELRQLLIALQRPSAVTARNLCGDQLDAWVKKGFRGERNTRRAA